MRNEYHALLAWLVPRHEKRVSKFSLHLVAFSQERKYILRPLVTSIQTSEPHDPKPRATLNPPPAFTPLKYK